MASTPLYSFPLDPDRKARWVAAAAHARVSLAEFVRQTVDARVNGETATVIPRAPADLAAFKGSDFKGGK